ncbi:methyltransferase domain-containing protein [Candidatus Pacearchaeota archaeon]|nr:methyltransferase domain-containing protein [Candidatus Pacearchaeota archaeon]
MGLPFNGETIETESLGGSETAAYYVAKELAAKGNKVTLFTNSEKEGEWDGVKYVFAGRSTDQTPLGDRFHFYAENTPHDVLIIQRHPSAFQYPWAAGIKLWWVHDLAQVRNSVAVQSNLWNMDGILTVSDFHKEQYIKVYGLNPEIVFPIQNGIDLDLFGRGEELFKENSIIPLNTTRYDMQEREGQVRLLYSSRPERGLEHLVAYNGIMERLAKIDDKYHLYVCAYENTTADTQDYYQYLKNRCEELPNVTILGSLTKQELADVMRQCDVMVYPTPGPQQPNFEEVSCITAMECMAAGLPFISTVKGALPETCKDSGSTLLELTEDGSPDLQAFVDLISDENAFINIEGVKASQLEAAKKYDWSITASMLMSYINICINKNRSDTAKAKHMLEMSDIYALKEFDNMMLKAKGSIADNIHNELYECYGFAFENYWEKHYAEYYEYEKERGVDYGAEMLDRNPRFEYVSSVIKSLPPKSVVIDYGCAHGHYTINLAKRFPDKEFVGIDITFSNVRKAREWAEQDKVTNVRFIHGTIPQEPETGLIKTFAESGAEIGSIPLADCIIAAEVIEHIGNPAYYIDTLCNYLKDENSQMVITTPFGPWEAMGYEEHHPWRAHVHHFDREDLHELWGHFPKFEVAIAASGKSKWGSMLGSYITTFNNPMESVRSAAIDMNRKFENMVPRQTVSLCMIVKDAEDSIKKCLDSVVNVVDEIILAIDETTSDNTIDMINLWDANRKGNWPIVKTINIKSPLEIGFDEARNLSIENASGDWVLWMDSDEIMVHSENMFKYLQNNSFDGYAIKQHHFAVEPLGVMKTDLPCRLFRNHKGVRFFGVVHEHPEKELNKGVGFVQLIPDLEIAHHGYTTEAIRRSRFERNINLLVRDREKYPERILGKMLWLRDLSQMCKYELDVNGGQISNDMKERAIEGIKIWEELLEGDNLRMIIDSMDFYSLLSKINGEAFEMGFAIDTSKMNGGLNMNQALPIMANFAKKEHAEALLKAIFNEKVKTYDSKYF